MSGSVSKKTSFLVAGADARLQARRQGAALGVRILDEAALEQILENKKAAGSPDVRNRRP